MKKYAHNKILDILDGILLAMIILTWVLAFGCLYWELEYCRLQNELANHALSLRQGSWSTANAEVLINGK